MMISLAGCCKQMKFLSAFAAAFVLGASSPALATGTASENRTPTYQLPQGTAGGGAADSAKQSQGKQGATQGMAVAMGVMQIGMGGAMVAQGNALNASKCACGTPLIISGVMMIGMGMMSLAQGASLGKTGAGAGDAANAMSSGMGAWDGGSFATDPNSSAGMGGLTAEQAAALNKAKADLAAQGVTIADGKINAKGKSYPLASFGSVDGMKAMGFSDAEIANAMSKNKDIAGKVAGKSQVAALSADGGGGGGRAAASLPPDPGPDYSALFGEKKAKDKKEVSVAGMTKKYGGDVIGVSGDNIFEMVTRRYKSQDAKNSFIRDLAGGH
jgi:hypothetical protein